MNDYIVVRKDYGGRMDVMSERVLNKASALTFFDTVTNESNPGDVVILYKLTAVTTRRIEICEALK